MSEGGDGDHEELEADESEEELVEEGGEEEHEVREQLDREAGGSSSTRQAVIRKVEPNRMGYGLPESSFVPINTPKTPVTASITQPKVGRSKSKSRGLAVEIPNILADRARSSSSKRAAQSPTESIQSKKSKVESSITDEGLSLEEPIVARPSNRRSKSYPESKAYSEESSTSKNADSELEGLAGPSRISGSAGGPSAESDFEIGEEDFETWKLRVFANEGAILEEDLDKMEELLQEDREFEEGVSNIWGTFHESNNRMEKML
ncbi:hypothetical protein BJ508DRAFT_337143, partial [Ascobolus immersus RN42]